MPTRTEELVEAFDQAWRHPHPHAWDDLIADDFAFVQPLLRSGTGRERWHEETARLLALLPDLTGRVTTWAVHDQHLFITIAFTATAGGRALEFEATDRFTLDGHGRLGRRVTHVDTLPLIGALLRRPTVWPRWWRSGIGPLSARRRLLPGPA